MAALFPGRGVELSSTTAFWSGEFRPVEEIPPPVRHALGYERFVKRVIADGEDAAALAAHPQDLVRYLRRHRSDLIASGDPLLDSAGVFLGNSLIARVADAHWQVVRAGQPEVSQGPRLGGGAAVMRTIRAILDADEDRLAEFWTFLQQWDGHDAAAEEAERRLALRQHLQVPSTPYRRPDGADLVGALDALIVYLAAHYRATATSTAPLPNDPETESLTVSTTRITPSAVDAAPLVIAVDPIGAIAVRAGALHEFSFYGPNITELETTLLAVAAGAYREAYPLGPDHHASFHLGSIDNSTESTGWGLIGALDPELRDAAATQLAQVPDGWRPWELRETARR